MPPSSSVKPLLLSSRARSVAAALAGGALVLPALGGAAHAAVPADAASAATIAAPAENVFVSDLEWVSERNGEGPAERDTAVGGQAEGDGPVMTLDGFTYDKGVGAHADSAVRIYLGGQCWSFRADVGIDDSRGDLGSVAFAVVGDGETLAVTPTLTGSSAAERIFVDVSGVEYLDLVVDKVEHQGDDHANWAAARLICGDTLVRDVGAPSVADGPGTASDSVTIPAVEGAEYLVDDVMVPPGEHPVRTESIVVMVRAAVGYQLDPEIGAPSWGFAFERSTEERTEEPTDGATAEPTPEPVTDTTAEPTDAPAERPTGTPVAAPPTTEHATPGAGANGVGMDAAPAPTSLRDELPSTGGAVGSGVIGALGLLLTGALATTLAARRRSQAV